MATKKRKTALPYGIDFQVFGYAPIGWPTGGKLVFSTPHKRKMDLGSCEIRFKTPAQALKIQRAIHKEPSVKAEGLEVVRDKNVLRIDLKKVLEFQKKKQTKEASRAPRK